jgi:hypothetical protein
MVYIPPKDLGINYDSDINLNNLLSISDDNIKDFMKIFTGLSDSNINNPTL